MKFINKVLTVFILAGALSASDNQIQTPSSVPIEVFKMKENQIGIGYIQFGIDLELEDEYYDDKIGDARFKSKGAIVTLPTDGGNYLIGDIFELSFTAGSLDGELDDNIFTDDGKTYNNTYDKDGFYIGIKPSFNIDIYTGDSFSIKNSTTLHLFAYNIDGEFSVDDGARTYKYDETNYGLALKPTTVIQATYYPIHSLGLTIFGGASYFVAVDYVEFDGTDVDGFEDEDTETSIVSSDVEPIFGYDLSYRFSNDSVVSLSSILSKQDDDTSTEVVLRYIFTF